MLVTTPFLEPSRSCLNDNILRKTNSSMRLISKLLILICFIYCPAAFPAEQFACEEWFPASGKAKGVMIVTHGLNVLPAKMNQLASHFASNGYEVLRPSFRGHCGKDYDLQAVKAEQWEEDARRFHAQAKVKADALKVPLFLAAYSFSGLIFQSMSEELPFARRIYLAPALETHFWYPIAIFLVNLWPVNFFRTLIPDGYFAQEYGGTRSVIAMNHFFLRWGERRKNADTVPTLIWADPADELVHGPKLKLLAESRPGWEFRALSVSGSTLPVSYHHLVIDEPSMGLEEWTRFTQGSLKFLEGK